MRGVAGIDDWWQAGERVQLAGHEIFVRRMGAGRSMTLIHGFPSSSYDWARVAPDLAEGHALLMPDLLGFGASDKPRQHRYSILEQADLVQALWERERIVDTIVVAHDYAVSVTQELLARDAPQIRAVYFLNGGLYPDLHRPEPAQTALLDPETGPQLSAALTEEIVAQVLRPTFPEHFDHTADAADIWRSLARDEGYRNLHLLIHYMTDRRANEERWVRALEDANVPVAFIWGMLDPVSGAHMAERIAERLPDAPFTRLDDVGHWPPLEAPERVLAAISS
jgi:pimeloyl-ACP methyl ester carboxylesterase